MPAARQGRPTHSLEDDEALKRISVEPEESLDSDGEAASALPDLGGGSLQPAAWLALQQTIGNSAVGGLVASRRAGKPLPANARHEMEASFGRDFGQVQVHTGPEADQATKSLDAAAFTVGSDIYLGSALEGLDDPISKQVLGEELAHVAQGVGEDDISRITEPDETAERQAHAAGRSAAAGQKAEVTAAPEADGAVARFNFGDLKKLYEPGKLRGPLKGPGAAPPVKAELKDEEKDRLRAGAFDVLVLMRLAISTKMAEQSGKLDPKGLIPIAQNTMGLRNFILSFDGPPPVKEQLESAAISAAAGTNALLAAIDPVGVVVQVTESLANVASEIEGLATPPPAAPAPQPGAQTPEALTAADVEQLKGGVVNPLRSITEQLNAEVRDLKVIADRLKSIPSLLQSFTKPAAIAPQLRRKAATVETSARALQAVSDGALGAVNDAIREWSDAIVVLGGLVTRSPTTTAGTEAINMEASAGDDEGEKPG